MLGYVAWYYLSVGAVLFLTALLDDGPNKKSKTHEEGRAVDIRTKALSSLHKNRLVHQLNGMFGDMFGTAPEGVAVLKVAILEDEGGENEHLHLQCRNGLTLSWF